MSVFHRVSRSTITAVENPTAPAVHCVTAKYRLTDCDDSAVHSYSNSDLSAVVGKVVKLNEQSGCWAVEDWNTGIPDVAVIAALTIKKNKRGKKLIYDDCTACGATQRILLEFTDTQLVGPEYTSHATEATASTDTCVITGSLFFKALVDDPNSDVATLAQLYCAADGTQQFVFAVDVPVAGRHLHRYFPIKNGKRVNWHSGNADTASSTTQELVTVAGDMIQIGFLNSTTGDVGDLAKAYAHDAARTAAYIPYETVSDDANAGDLIRTAGPEATYITYSGYYMVYGDMGVPWRIKPPAGVTVYPKVGVGAKLVYIDIGGISEGHAPLRGTFTWTSSAFGILRKRTRPMWFTRIDATIPTTGTTGTTTPPGDGGPTPGTPEFPPIGPDFAPTTVGTIHLVIGSHLGGAVEGTWSIDPVTRAPLDIGWVSGGPGGYSTTSAPEWNPDYVEGGIFMNSAGDVSAVGPDFLNVYVYYDAGRWIVGYYANRIIDATVSGIISIRFRNATTDRMSYLAVRIGIGVNSIDPIH